MKILALLPLLLLLFLNKVAASDAVVAETDPVVCSAPSVITQQSTNGDGWAFFSTLFDSSSWPARWQCGKWTTVHGWVYIVSDIVIWFSYFMIPLILGYFVYRKKKEAIPFKSIVLLFIVFILACGLTHLVDAAIFWWPVYKLSALIRFLTAVVSLATVFALIRIAPKVLELRSLSGLEQMVEERTAELKKLNAQLKEEANQRALAEERLKNLYLELEKKVGERTNELHNMNQELEAFTYSVSHDLRAPLRAIDGYARILEEDYNARIDAHGKHLISVITKNALYMGQLIDDLLDFSRTSRSELIKSTFDADKEVRKITADLMAQEKNRNIQIHIKTLDACKGDTMMLRQVWVNLISNALKYTRKTPESRIEIFSQILSQEVQYTIRDNGVGFEMKYVGKLFGVFQRLHNKDQFEGTGVGLALVKRILDRHQGRIWTESEVNKGATFHFTLPHYTTAVNHTPPKI
jgi:two-component system, chemotaxis family, sensor kinase Cph1